MDTKKFTTTIQTKSMVEQVKENIINAIIMGELKPGDQLPTETEMCELFGVSRNTIREVIKILTTYGIVYIKRPEGTFVSEGYNPNMLNPMMFGILLGKKPNNGVKLLDMFHKVFSWQMIHCVIM